MSTERFKGRPPIMTQEQLDLLKTSSQFLTAAEWAEKFNVQKTLIYSFCAHHGLKLLETKVANAQKKVVDKPAPAANKKIRRYMNNEEFTNSRNSSGKMVRPAAKYGNKSREELIDYYLKLEI